MSAFRAMVAGGPLAIARTVYLTVGGVAALVFGVWLLGREDPGGLVVILAGAGILVFLPTRFFPIFGSLVIAVDGLVIAQPAELLLGLVGAAFAVLTRPQVASRVPTTEDAVTAAPTTMAEADASQAPAAGLHVRTLGKLEMRDGDSDYAGAFLRRDSHSFLWLYLLSWRVAEGDKPVLRSDLAHALNPLVPAADQLKALRNRIWDLRKLPPAVAKCVSQQGDLFAFDVSACDLDVERLRTLATRVRPGRPLPDSELDELELGLRHVGWGDFLSVWEEVEQRQTKGHGDAREVVMAARRRVDDMRADIALAIADAHLLRRQALAALAVLEPAVAAAPDREDLLQRLELAYVKTDQHRKAEELRAGTLPTGVN